MSDKQDELQPIIVKKIKKGGGHHGGAWKVAYADFVTAMMAFFLLLWLLNVTTEEQKMGIADYFDPNPKISNNRDGSGGMLGGLSVSPEGAMVSQVQPISSSERSNQNPALRPGSEAPRPEDETPEQRQQRVQEELDQQAEQERFEEAQETLKETLEKTPELKELADNLMMDVTREGLRIQIIDQKGEPMFPLGSAQMYEKTQKLMAQVVKAIADMPNEVSIRGHTDGNPYGPGATYTNWELSADRANSSRRVMLAAGLNKERLNNVIGKSDTDHLYPENPFDARNRRISIILLRDDLIVREGANKSSKAALKKKAEEKQLYQKTPAAVEFP